MGLRGRIIINKLRINYLSSLIILSLAQINSALLSLTLKDK